MKKVLASQFLPPEFTKKEEVVSSCGGCEQPETPEWAASQAWTITAFAALYASSGVPHFFFQRGSPYDLHLEIRAKEVDPPDETDPKPWTVSGVLEVMTAARTFGLNPPHFKGRATYGPYLSALEVAWMAFQHLKERREVCVQIG